MHVTIVGCFSDFFDKKPKQTIYYLFIYDLAPQPPQGGVENASIKHV